MDFKRIEIIFLLAFLGVNFFLFRTYEDALAEKNAAASVSQTQSIEKRLTHSEVTTEGSLSTEKHSGYYLSGEEHTWTPSPNTNYNQLKNVDLPLTVGSNAQMIINEKKLETGINDFLAQTKSIEYGNQYAYSVNFSQLTNAEDTVLALQSFEGLSIYDPTAQIVLTLENYSEGKRVSKYSQTYVDELEPLREKQELITEKTAVTTLYNNNRIPDKSKILWTQLAYTCIFKIRDKRVYVPVWFVALSVEKNTIQLEQVNAISNVVTTNNPVAEVKN